MYKDIQVYVIGQAKITWSHKPLFKMADEDECCGGCTIKGVNMGPAYGTPESAQRLKNGLVSLRKIAYAELIFGLLALVSSVGALVLGCMVRQISYPVVDGLPLSSAVMTLISGFYSLRTTQLSYSGNPTAQMRCSYMTSYILRVVNISIGANAAGFSGWVIGVCTSVGIKDLPKCFPNHDIIMVFAIINCIVFAVIAVVCIVGMVHFCRYAHSFGFKNRDSRVVQLEREVAELRNQVGRQQPPPAYSAFDNSNYQTKYE